MALLAFGVIRSFDRQTYLADVELRGYQGTLLTGVPVAWSVREDLAVDGAACVVLMPQELKASEAVVLALFDGPPAEDPLFDPVVGHKHRGLARDGPELG